MMKTLAWAALQWLETRLQHHEETATDPMGEGR